MQNMHGCATKLKPEQTLVTVDFILSILRPSKCHPVSASFPSRVYPPHYLATIQTTRSPKADIQGPPAPVLLETIRKRTCLESQHIIPVHGYEEDRQSVVLALLCRRPPNLVGGSRETCADTVRITTELVQLSQIMRLQNSQC